jgi:hypothetical protein
MNEEFLSPDFPGDLLDPYEVYLIACSLAWNRSGNVHAGNELVHCLASHDPILQEIAETGLVERGADSFSLVETALASGRLRIEDARSCLQKIILPTSPDPASSN